MRKPIYETVEDYLAESELYRLGVLPTEGFHPLTSNLSHLAASDLPQAMRILREVDAKAIQALQFHGEDFSRLSMDILQTRRLGGRIFLCGCGATGRLSLALESFWREMGGQEEVIAFMAGGDVALVRSVENFEDHSEYGARHLRTLGFRDGDLLIAITEGGETPFVIGATEEAAQFSRSPYFIFCNPPDLLAANVERSAKMIKDIRIQKIAISTGPMALSGSTRLQASTVQMLGVGLALFSCKNSKPLTPEEFSASVADFLKFYQSRELGFLTDFIQAEAKLIQAGGSLVYETDCYGVTILTDTTERSPTFSLQPFENQSDPKETKLAWSYLSLPQTTDATDAWNKILGRLPRGLVWPELSADLSEKILLGFDFSKNAMIRRQREGSTSFQIFQGQNEILFSLAGASAKLSLLHSGEKVDLFYQSLALKLVLNMHSLLFMGRLGRYEKNVMTWVRPSNGKLIDRAIRYSQYLLMEKGQDSSYEEVARMLFKVYADLDDDEPVVMRTVEEILRKK